MQALAEKLEYTEHQETLVIDDFLNDFDWLREYCDLISYDGQVNPVDNVMYPGINTAIPAGVMGEILYKLEQRINGKIALATMFFRMTHEGEDVPHQAHTDATMGTHGCVIYLNRPEHEAGGTSFVRHVDEGMEYGPIDKRQEEIWCRDTNIEEKWEITQLADMKSNRAIVFDTMKMHRPEPPRGFGTTNKDSRLVLVTFFTVVNDG